MSTNYTVQQGDCIDSIAFRHGFFPETIWKHPDNRELRNLRKDPNVLQPGDVVVIPDLQKGTVACATEQRHSFTRKGVPAKLRLVFYRPLPPEEQQGNVQSAAGGSASQEDGMSVFEEVQSAPSEVRMEPIANQACMIVIDDSWTDSQSDGDGLVELAIPPDAQSACVKFFAGTPEELSFPLSLGEMDPIDSIVGVRKRLHNLGYRCPAEGDEMDAILQDALTRFQQSNGLQASGQIDKASMDKLVQVHGS